MAYKLVYAEEKLLVIRTTGATIVWMLFTASACLGLSIPIIVMVKETPPIIFGCIFLLAGLACLFSIPKILKQSKEHGGIVQTRFGTESVSFMPGRELNGELSHTKWEDISRVVIAESIRTVKSQFGSSSRNFGLSGVLIKIRKGSILIGGNKSAKFLGKMLGLEQNQGLIDDIWVNLAIPIEDIDDVASFMKSRLNPEVEVTVGEKASFNHKGNSDPNLTCDGEIIESWDESERRWSFT